MTWGDVRCREPTLEKSCLGKGLVLQPKQRDGPHPVRLRVMTWGNVLESWVFQLEQSLS